MAVTLSGRVTAVSEVQKLRSAEEKRKAAEQVEEDQARPYELTLTEEGVPSESAPAQNIIEETNVNSSFGTNPKSAVQSSNSSKKSSVLILPTVYLLVKII